MHRKLLVATKVISMLGFGLPAFAADTGQSSITGDQLIAGATKAVQDVKGDHRFEDLMKQAKGVFIVPTMVKGALIAGANGGQGVLLKRDSSGWSEPAFLTLGTLSLGAQAGGSAGSTIMLLMTDKAVNDFTQANNFSLGANAGLTVIGYSAKGQAPVGKGDVIIWSNQSGAFAGASVSATDITSNSQEDANFYGKHVTTPQILNGSVPRESAANTLLNALPA